MDSRHLDDKCLASERETSPRPIASPVFFMAIRQPPDDYIPRVVRGGRVQLPRVVRYEEPRPPWHRRLLRFLLRPYIALPLLFPTALIVRGVGYYCIVFPARLANLLQA